MITQNLGMLATSFLVGGFMLGRPGWLSLVVSLIPLTYGYFKFKDVKAEIAELTGLSSEGKKNG